VKFNAIAPYITKPGMRTNSFMEPRNQNDKYWADDYIDKIADKFKIKMLRYNESTDKYDYVELDEDDG